MASEKSEDRQSPGSSRNGSIRISEGSRRSSRGSKKIIPEFLDQLPDIPSQPEQYTPLPYTFRLPVGRGKRGRSDGRAQCPPFYLQLDHTLAVIWSLFSKKSVKKPLGIAQLQWALIFLSGITDAEGERPKDVAVCIQAIEDELIEQYAALVDGIKPPNPDGKGYCFRMDNEDEEGGDPQIKTEQNEKEDDDEDEMLETIISDLPFSINYAEMVSRSNSHGKTCDRDECNKKERGCKCSIAKTDPITKGEMVCFLDAWRKEQLNKIQGELKRLHCIEAFMESASQENFKPYLEDKKQLDALIAGITNSK